MMKKENKPFVECECGMKIYGNSQLHAEKLLPKHKESRNHKERMSAIKFNKENYEENKK